MGFLLEIYTEEIPAFDQIKAAENIKKYFNDELKTYFGNESNKITMEAFFTPRRLAVRLLNLPQNVVINDETIRGPSIKAPQIALDGFLQQHNIKQEALTTKDNYYFYTKKGGIQQTMQVLPQLCLQILQKISMQWAKNMPINNTKTLWIRPIQNILAIFNGNIIGFEFAGLKANNKTYGHRFFQSNKLLQLFGFCKNNNQITIKNPLKYEQTLQKHAVIASFEKRVQSIKNQLKQMEQKFAIKYDGDENLINENAMLCEYPLLIDAKISDEFIQKIPHKLIELTIKQNQRYLMFKNNDKASGDEIFDENLSPYFAIVTNNPYTFNCVKTLNNIRSGNLRVLNARLSDAKFFIESDISTGLNKMNEKLSSIQFIQCLGSVKDRVSRMQSIFSAFSSLINLSNTEITDTNAAIEISKNDLASITVSEFTELQGYTGAYIAFKLGFYNSNIVRAIKNQYKFNVDNTNAIENNLKFVDNFEKLVSFFATNQIPTSSKDPYALKRSANFILEFFVSIRITQHIDLFNLIDKAFSLTDYNQSTEESKQKLKIFILDRLQALLCDSLTQNAKDYMFKLASKYLLNKTELTLLNIQKLYGVKNQLSKNADEVLNFVAILQRLKNTLPADFKDDTTDFQYDSLTISVDKNYKHDITSFYDESYRSVEIFTYDFANSNDTITYILRLTGIATTFADKVIINHDNEVIKKSRQALVYKFISRFEDILV